MPKKQKHITTKEIKTAMERKWSAPEYALILEVSDATGGRRGRIADALIMGLWPSRGINLDGVEIKTQRADWLRELKDPQKAESISRFCDHWWIHATPDVVKEEELPTGWGLRVYDGRIWKTVVEAAPRDSEPVDRDFLAAILRRIDQMVDSRADSLAEKKIEQSRALMDREIDLAVQMRTRKVDALAKVAEAFEEETGLDLERLSRSGKAKNAAKITAAIINNDLDNPWSSMVYLITSLRDAADDIVEASEELGIETPCEKKRQANYLGRKENQKKQRQNEKSHLRVIPRKTT